VQVPPNSFVALSAVPPQRRFPGQAVAEVRAFDIGSEPGVNPSRCIGAHCSIVAEDGTLCPQLLAPGRSLSVDQVARLLPIVASPYFVEPASPGPKRSTCSDESVSAFVFFDEEHRPIGYTTLSATARSWNFVPPLKGAPRCTKETAASERAVLSGLCEELNLRCFQQTSPGNDPPAADNRSHEQPTERERAEAARQLLLTLLPPPGDVPLDVPLKATREAERRRLCAWHYRAVSVATEAGLGYPWPHNPDASIGRVGEAWELRLKNFEECLRGFPECDTVVGDAVKSLAYIYRSIADSMPEQRSGCVFGVEVLTSPR
jgi:hypothetical protein